MSTEIQATGTKPCPNPFAFPTDTDFRFVLLIFAFAAVCLVHTRILTDMLAPGHYKQFEQLRLVYGLFAAFVTGCVATIGILGLNLAYGGSIDPGFFWTTFTGTVNGGAAVSLIPAMWLSARIERRRELLAESVRISDPAK